MIYLFIKMLKTIFIDVIIIIIIKFLRGNIMNNYFSFVPIYNLFIEKYMIKSNPSFVVIYIYIKKVYK